MRYLYKHNRRRYRESWLVGYRMSSGSQCAITYNPTDDNYLALALAVLGNMPAKEALKHLVYFQTKTQNTLKMPRLEL